MSNNETVTISVETYEAMKNRIAKLEELASQKVIEVYPLREQIAIYVFAIVLISLFSIPIIF